MSRSSTRSVLTVIAALAVVGCLVTGGLVAVFVSFVDGLGGSDAWKSDAVAERDLPALFGCRLPAAPVHYTSRAFGFQDSFFEVVVELPPGSAEAFLGANHLTRGATAVPEAEVLEVIRSLVSPAPELTATELTLPPALLPDGGPAFLQRSGELLEGPAGVTWLHLRAFDT